MISGVSLTQDIQSRAKELLPEATRLRRHLHKHPELSFQERETAAFVARELEAIGIPYTSGVGGYGLVATVGPESARARPSDGHSDTAGAGPAPRGPRAPSDTAGAETGAAGREPQPHGTDQRDQRSLPIVALRADMDALPIPEETELDFASENGGVMHACGHDVHTSCLLGAARMLWERRESLPGIVKLIFQPAEERLPGGAAAMIRDGALQDPQPASIIGQHINPELPSGTLGFRAGTMMASVDDVYITVRGTGGHAAYPHRLQDPVVAAAGIVGSLQQLVSRRTRPDIPAVLSFGRIIGEGATNVVPNTVELHGTFRTVDEEYRDWARPEIRRIAEEQARVYGARADVEIEHGFPSLPNDPELTHRIWSLAEEVIGAETVTEIPLFLGGEDFAYYAQEMPACFYNLGTTNFTENPHPAPLHSSQLLVDESCLERGAAFLAIAAVHELEYHAGR
jgi:amidohydrolase